jgi:hypothetical protein
LLWEPRRHAQRLAVAEAAPFEGDRIIVDIKKSCPICGHEVVSKRKDAVFCKNPACRKKAQQARKEEEAKLPPVASSNKASVVLTFPDGSRWLLELSPLQVAGSALLPSLAQVAASTVQDSPGTAPAAVTTPQTTDVAGSAPAPLAPAVGTAPPAVTAPQTTDAADPAPAPLAPAVAPEPTQPSTPTAPATQNGLRTVELYFTDQTGRRLYFRDAVRRRLGGGWTLNASVQARLALNPDEGYGLGGVPGRWNEFFPGCPPTRYGLDADIGVLYADDNERRERTYAADPDLLQQTLGTDWRTRIRTRAGADKSQPQ